MSKQFWERWLMGITLGVIIYGGCLMLFPRAMHTLFNTLFFGESDANGTLTHYIHLIYGVLGAVLIGWMVMLLGIIRSPFRHGERWAWQTITSSVLIWFLVDSGFSIVIGVVEHAIFNVGFAVLYTIPLAATYRDFHDRR